MVDAITCSIERLTTRGSTQEVLLTLAIPQEHAAKVAGFLTRIGEQIGVAFATINNSTPSGQAPATSETERKELPPSGGNRLARYLHTSGYFRNPKLWVALDEAKIYTQATHKKWVEQEKCYFAHDKGALTHLPCAGDVCAHHVTSAALPAAGKGENPRKPPHWYTLPACFNHHTYVHNKDCSRAEKEAHVVAAVAMMAGQAKSAMKAAIGIPSLSNLTLDQLHNFEGSIGLPLFNSHVMRSDGATA